MADPRLKSDHLLDLFPRREAYRQARESLLGARGSLTLSGEKAFGLTDDVEDWPSLAPIEPDQVLPGTKYRLVDERAGRLYPLSPAYCPLR